MLAILHLFLTFTGTLPPKKTGSVKSRALEDEFGLQTVHVPLNYDCWRIKSIIGLLRGGSLIFPKVPQSSQTESLGFPSYPPLEHPPLRNPTNPTTQILWDWELLFNSIWSCCQCSSNLQANPTAYTPENQHIPWKLMVGRWNFL